MNDLVRDPFAIDLSIDFDFFIREDVNWDFGHQDNPLFASSLVWNSRYNYIDLHRETSQLKYADFPARQLIEELSELFGRLRPRHFGWADSHAYAFEFFTSLDVEGKQQPPPGMLINIDAHHDGWPQRMDDPKPQAENWALHLQKEWGAATQFMQCYPKWKDALLDGPSAVQNVITVESWKEFVFRTNPKLKHDRHYIRNVFICSSQSWVPPHHDLDFVNLVQRFAKRSVAARELQRIPRRVSPSQEEADRMRQRHAEQLKALELMPAEDVRKLMSELEEQP